MRGVIIGWLALCIGGGMGCVKAQSPYPYPTKSIRLLVPNAPGGGADSSARIFAQGLSLVFGHPVVVDNRAGAGGNVSGDMAAHAPPDGYTVLWGSVSHSVGVSLSAKPGYDLVKDFSPTAQLVMVPYGVALHPSLPAKTLKELIALAKQKPHLINFATSGSGTYLAAQLFLDMAQIHMTSVLYKGGSPGLVALLSGEVSMSFTSLVSILPHVKTAKVRLLAVTSANRSVAAPKYPTVIQAGLAGFEATSWYGPLLPKGTAQGVVERWTQECNKLLQDSALRTRLIDNGVEPVGGTSAEFAAHIKSEVEKWAKVIKKTGARMD